jgi:hypothetical protein
MLFAVGVPPWDEATAPWSSWRSTTPPVARTLWYGDRRLPLLSSGVVGLRHDKKAQVLIRPGGATILEAGVHFYDGRADQSIAGRPIALSMAVTGISAADIPGYRHRMLLSVQATPGQVAATQPTLGGLGSSPRVLATAIEVSALGPQPIGLDANPAWVLYDLLCRPVWGLGINPDDVDLASFQAAAVTLVSEGHGCSVVIEQIEDAARVFAAITSQIDGVVYEAPSTGKITIKLIRGGYDPDDLPVMNSDNVIGRPDVDDIHERDSPNEIRVSFTSRAHDYKRDILPWKKEGNVTARGNQRRPVSFDAPGCTTPEIAAKIAARELSVVGRPLRTIRIKVTRAFYALELGDVVKVHLPQYQINNEIHRVLEVNFGQLADGTIEVRLIRDVFDQTVGGFAGDPEPDTTPTTLIPITHFVFDEAPYHLMRLAAIAGSIPSIGEQSMMAFAAAEASDPATQWRVDTQAGGSGSYSFGTTSDISPQPFPVTALVAVEYPRHLEPFDDTTGLVLEGVVSGGGPDALDFIRPATASEIRATGRHLALLGGANITPTNGDELYQTGEIISYETLTDLGGGQFCLNNVQRGLLDTAPVTHPVGTRFFLITPSLAVGRRNWATNQYARGYAVPQFGGVDGSDGLSYASHDVLINPVGRRALPLRAADMRLSGFDMDGTEGPQSDAPDYPRVGEFKAVSRLEGAFDVDARENRIDAGVVVRGDEAAWDAEPGTTWTLAAEKVGGEEGDVALVGHTGLTEPSTVGALLGPVGHGEIDIRLDSYRTIGFTAARSWQSPVVRVDAPHWRDLLANSSFEYGALTPGWSTTSGTVEIATGPNCLPRYSSGGFWVQGIGDATIKQVVDVTGYKPNGLTATVSYYARNFNGGSKAVTVTIRALDAADVELADASDSLAGPASHWQRDSVSLTLPPDTAKIAVEVALEASPDVGGPRAGVTRIRLQIGQMTAELLTNPSFDGALTGWTNVTNSFVVNTTNPYSSRNGTIGAAQGGAFAFSEIKQEVAIPAGYEYGTALLQLARSTTLDNDTGEVVLEALDSMGAVLESLTTGAEYALVQGFPLLDVWERRRLALQLPDNTVTLRVRLLAVRTLSSGNSGACFDDLSLLIHKDLDPVFTRDLDFRDPSWQPLPKNWQQFHLAFPTLPTPFMSWDGANAEPMVKLAHALSGPTFAWSDASTPPAADFRGFWDIGPHILYPDPVQRFVLTTEAYQFTRAIAASAIDLQATGPDDTTGDEYGVFALDEPFTIAVMFRTDEPTWSGAAGLVGRRSATGIGWGMRLDASGRLQVVLQGASGTATVTGTAQQADAAPHWGFLVNDPAAGLLRLFSDTAADTLTASTAGLGSLAASGVPLRIGRDGPASAAGGVQISRVFFWDVALTAGEVAAILRYGADPSGLGISWTSDRAVWASVPDHESIPNGAALLRYSARHIPIGSGSGGYGLVTAAASTNKIPSNDFTAGATWAADTGATLTQGLVDATGLARGVRVTNGTASKGLRCLGLTMGTGTPLSVVLFARTNDGVSRSLIVELRDAGDVLIGSQTVVLGSGWERYHVQLGPWAASTPTAYLRFMLASSALGSFDLSHIMWAAFGADAPFAIHDAGTTLSGAGGTLIETLPLQANHEGELFVAGAASTASPPADRTLAAIDWSSNVEGLRALGTGAAAAPLFTLYDGAGAPTVTSGSAFDWSQGFELRARWNSLALPESPGDQVGLVVAASSADGATYAPLAFPIATSPLDTIYIGGDANIGGPPNAIIHRVIVRAREAKLEG